MPGLTLPRKVFEAMLAQARAVAPLEACGLLSGRAGEVLEAHAMTNADQSEEHFSMLPQEQFAVAKRIRATGQELLAIYHSHPATPARPSVEDIRLALTPDVLHVVLSLADPSGCAIRGFRIEDTRVTDVPIHITPNGSSAD